MTETIGFCQETRPESCAFVLFGATGDLAGRKILPALFGLCKKGLAPRNFYILLAARTPLSRPELERRLSELMARACPGAPPEAVTDFLGRVDYLRADYESGEFYRALGARLDELDAKHGIKKKRLFYLAIPPAAFGKVTDGLGDSGLLAEPGDRGGWSRLIIEKPYGSSLERACAVDAGLKKDAAESQIYRIDHFTGKETVQNVLALRAANSVFDETWNNRYIDHVQITVFEELGLEGRADLFENLGLARDMMSHILQLAAITAMDLPSSFRDTDFKTEKRRFFESIPERERTAAAADAVRAQYEGYRQEPGVAANSGVETFLAFRFFVDNDRWRGVPFYVRAGKKTGAKCTRISLVYRKPEHGIFRGMDIGYPNIFTFNIHPDEDMSFSLIAKHPGPRLCFVPKTMRMDYPERAGETAAPTDYERLLIEAMAGDQTLFLSSFEMQFLWQFLSPLLAAWQADPYGGALYSYTPGTSGPPQAAALIERDGRAWV
ncbi:MAG: glucose-6-phosphate dehydrogenase [Elusimicrobia bacterium GWC2_64_44]|nr:MAG: glucose-6-phosphate dehydrogenase [Elusimicrobia bacterium GWC2_64_44]